MICNVIGGVPVCSLIDFIVSHFQVTYTFIKHVSTTGASMGRIPFCHRAFEGDNVLITGLQSTREEWKNIPSSDSYEQLPTTTPDRRPATSQRGPRDWLGDAWEGTG